MKEYLQSTEEKITVNQEFYNELNYHLPERSNKSSQTKCVCHSGSLKLLLEQRFSEEWASESLGRFVKTQIAGPTPKVAGFQ